ncbi:flagellar basal body rod protein FlgC [Halobacillus sp. Marseille-Q1614]|uniref:flagellar basal body rod protein FlgC n=1 Tax=Halobacillus sp. Marseille-Q1614 TaxID=2709134 RepID=UPI00156E9C8D|nr:flagellar basal body rod protein FlgC [Halobacillus sp. Marseille-Q1614]
MSIFHSMNVSASGMTAQRLRMDVATSNMANANTTRAVLNEKGEWQQPYRRKMVDLQPQEPEFRAIFQQALQTYRASGVKAVEIVDDETPFKQVFNPNHPDANEAEYVQMPNVDPLEETIDMMSATRSYEANITSLNASKGMLMKALEIGKQ